MQRLFNASKGIICREGGNHEILHGQTKNEKNMSVINSATEKLLLDANGQFLKN